MSKKNSYKRILLKIGGELLLGNREYGIDPKAVEKVAEQIKKVYLKNIELAIVVGGGNIFRGLPESKNGIDRTTADYMGMLATTMNGLALQDALEKIGIPTRMQSALNMPSVAENFIRRRAIRHMEKGRVVILAAGAGVPYVTADTGAALHGLELKCDVFMKTSSSQLDATALAMCKENNLSIVVLDLLEIETHINNGVKTKG